MSGERPPHLRLEIAAALALFVGLAPFSPLLEWMSPVPAADAHEVAPFSALFLVQVVLFTALSRRWRGETWADLGFPRIEPKLDLGFGVFVFFAGLAVVQLCQYVLVAIPDLWTVAPAPHVRGAWPLVVIGFAGIICTSIAEEFFYRGYLLKRWTSASGSAGSALFWTSLLFGLVHAYQGLSAPLQHAAWGFVLGGFVLLLGRVWPAALAHVLTNGYVELVNGA